MKKGPRKAPFARGCALLFIGGIAGYDLPIEGGMIVVARIAFFPNLFLKQHGFEGLACYHFALKMQAALCYDGGFYHLSRSGSKTGCRPFIAVTAGFGAALG